MAKRPTPAKASAVAPVPADDTADAADAPTVSEADTSAAPPPVPEHVEAAHAAEAAVAEATATPPPPEADPAPQADAAAPKIALDDVDSDGAGPYTPSAINSQILSGVIDADLLALGLAPSQSHAMLDAVMSQTLGLAMHNAVVRQQADRVVSQALISVACARMVERVGFAVGSPPVTPKPAAPSKPAAEKAP